MSTFVADSETRRTERAFSHEALLYAGLDGFVEGTLPFVRGGLEAGEPTLVIVSAEKIAALRAELGPDTGSVSFADMGQVGTNPARLIPAWREFVEDHGAHRPLRGIGEPVWPERSPAELVECQRHEALVNLAFADDPPLRLLCPYDTKALDPAVVEEAHRSHPIIVRNQGCYDSPGCRDLDAIAAPFAVPLPEPPPSAQQLAFGPDTLGRLRRFVATLAARAALSRERSADLVLAVNELATNSVRHGGGHGVLRAWQDADMVVCEVSDHGRIEEPLAGRQRPTAEQIGGHGLWLVNQICELVQVRTLPGGSVVRLHMRQG